MILKLFSVYDCKVQTYSVPHACKNRLEAARDMGDILKEGTHRFALHPEDYTLFEMGSFDLTTGEYVIEKTPISVGKLLDYLPS